MNRGQVNDHSPHTAQATELLGDLDIYTSAFRPMRNTISGNEGRAFMKIIVSASDDRVVGIHMARVGLF